MIVMKSVGVHVAADALALGNLAGAHREGGAIVVYGDDPWSDSTQVPADSRFISRHLFIPVIEPSDIQEVKDFVDLSLQALPPQRAVRRAGADDQPGRRGRHGPLPA